MFGPLDPQIQNILPGCRVVQVNSGIMNMSGGIIENGSAAFGGNIFVEEGDDLNHDDQITNEDVVALLWYSLFPEDYPLR